MTYALAFHLVFNAYWFYIRRRGGGAGLSERKSHKKRKVKKKKRKVERRKYFVHTLVSTFGNSSMQVSECVSLNRFHFMHEYRSISL